MGATQGASDLSRPRGHWSVALFFLGIGALATGRSHRVVLYVANIYGGPRGDLFARKPAPIGDRRHCHKLIGVALVAQPEFLFGGASHGHDIVAVAVGILGAALGACAYVTVRKLRETEHHLVVVFYFPLVSVVACAPMVIPDMLVPTPTEWLLLIGIGVCTQIAQIYLTKSLNLEKASRAMSVSYVQILFSAQWGLMFLGEIPNGLCILGALMVVAGTLVATRSL